MTKQVSVHLLTAGNPKVYEKAEGTYTKEGFYGIIYENNGKRVVDKYPVEHIFRVTEDY